MLTPHCYRCKCLVGLRVKSTSKYGSKSYVCKNCNTELARKYRATSHGRLANQRAIRRYRSTSKGKEAVSRVNKQMGVTYRHKEKARKKARYALKTGKIVKLPCFCGNKTVEMHHFDYSQPLVIHWVCRSCHAAIHKAVLN